MKTYPALDVRSTASDVILARVDDFGPTAVEERNDSLRIFFSTSAARDAALRDLAAIGPVKAIDVPDEDWARRSQQNLGPITVGRIRIFPNPEARIPHPDTIAVVIQPSMGFGTGHHATTRLCLAALQEIDLSNAFVLDVGTGSGVLAIAADRLGAARALGIDNDSDAIQSARENLEVNPEVHRVDFEAADLATHELPPADVVTANLTGALLIRAAALLLAAVRSGGTLILSGLLTHERDEVCRAFAPAAIVWERQDEEWVGLVLVKK
ncbi:MAG TPA: 50S ribosomal protein L11 methyltransferase [Vicinamibacterales bacterium]|nr:50S ribosomal protein L11 methyltransferase [Vicinamibacterales bacterium]